MPGSAVTATYTDFDRFVETLRTLKDRGMPDYEAFGPTNLHEIQDLMPSRTNYVRIIATICAVIGLVSFWYMCIASSLLYRIITGGKLPISNVPFVIPAYEGTILLGSLGAFFAGLYFARLGVRRPPADYDPRFSEDRYGIVIRCQPDECKDIMKMLTDTGAEEINEAEF